MLQPVESELLSGLVCDCCGSPLFVGERYYKTPGANICEDCIWDYISIAERRKPNDDDTILL